jgi:hypothetical protein
VNARDILVRDSPCEFYLATKTLENLRRACDFPSYYFQRDEHVQLAVLRLVYRAHSARAHGAEDLVPACEDAAPLERALSRAGRSAYFSRICRTCALAAQLLLLPSLTPRAWDLSRARKAITRVVRVLAHLASRARFLPPSSAAEEGGRSSILQ